MHMIRVIALQAPLSNAWRRQSPADTISLEAAAPLPPTLTSHMIPFIQTYSLLPLSSLPRAVAFPWQEGGVSRDTEGGFAAKWWEMGLKSEGRQEVLIPRAEALFHKEEAASLLDMKQLGRKASQAPTRVSASSQALSLQPCGISLPREEAVWTLVFALVSASRMERTSNQ